MSNERRVFDFAHPYAKTTFKAFLKRSSNSLDFNFFVNPLHSSAWLSLVIILGIFFFSLFGILKILGSNEDEVEKTSTYKILILTFWANFIPLYAYYGGAITTDLTVTDYKIPFTTQKEVRKVFKHY